MQLNLARKWRSQKFSTIIGQELVVRILKNGLFADCFFPVYLFSGTRGCGKTTTARVFAAAINCAGLAVFQKEPSTNEVPCGVCQSCVLMLAGKHPDFIEIDAASHTGVDNVREIIEAASLLPVIGRKKIYLIDEAHMLSKAAFNAFLKILEEPPPTALFMLATTEKHKIIDTVCSRCFQLFFQPVASDILIEHLKSVCEAEGIAYEEDGIHLVADEAHGSVRDAINVLERVRFSTTTIAKEAVLSVLQHVDIACLIDLLEQVCLGDKKEVVRLLEKIKFERYSQAAVWKKLIELIQSLLWLSYDIVRPQIALSREKDRLKKLSVQFSQERLIAVLEKLYSYEQIFLKTAAQTQLVELLFLTLCDSNAKPPGGSQAQGNSVTARSQPGKPMALSETASGSVPTTISAEVSARSTQRQAPKDDRWQRFLTNIQKQLDDPLVSSIFKQAHFDSYDEQQKILELTFAKKLSFFSGMLTTTQQFWQPVLNEVFGNEVICKPHFSEKIDEIKPIEVTQQLVEPSKFSSSSASRQKSVSRTSVAHLKHGKNAKLLLQFFPGTLSLVREGYE